MLRAPPISWLTICPLGQPEKAIGFEPQIELWLAPCNHTACRIRNRRRRHDNNMNLRKKRTPRASQHYLGWRAGQKSLLLPVAGEVFLLTLPFIERRYRTSLTMPTPVKLFSKTLLSFYLKDVFSFVFFRFLSSLHRRPRLVCNLAVGFSPT